jgi:hypothetical protein
MQSPAQFKSNRECMASAAKTSSEIIAGSKEYVLVASFTCTKAQPV